MSDLAGKQDDGSAAIKVEGKKSTTNDGEEKKLKLKGDCQKCGKATEDLTACLCFSSSKDGSHGGVILCRQCYEKDDVMKCQICKQLICESDDCAKDDCRSTEEAYRCGYSEETDDTDCDAVICTSCFEGKSSGWSHCFCYQVKFCPACSKRGGRSKSGISLAFHHCTTCGTLYCSDQKGDCGRECENDRCMKYLCCKCLGISDPRSIKYCSTECERECAPKKRQRHEDEYSNYGYGYGTGSNWEDDAEDGHGYDSY